MTVGKLKKMLEDYPDDLDIMIRTKEGFEELNVFAGIGIVDYWGDNAIYGDDISDFVLAALEGRDEDPNDDEAVAYVIALYEDKLTPKLILE